MNPEEWRKIEDLFHAALEHDVGERIAFLAQACAGDAELQLEVKAGFGGWRLELDGQIVEAPGESLSVRMRPEAATLVAFEDQEPLLAGLRRRRIIVDSPRVAADVEREGACPE